jgi:hypothetical protein
MYIASRPDGPRYLPALIATVLALLTPIPVPEQSLPPAAF